MMFHPFSEFVTYLVMSSDLPALKKPHFKSTIHGDGNIIVAFTTIILLELQEVCQRYLSLPLSVCLSHSVCLVMVSLCCAGTDGSFQQEGKP